MMKHRRETKAALEHPSDRIRNRMRLLHWCRHYVAYKLRIFRGLNTFSPLVAAFMEFDSQLGQGEQLFCDASAGRISDADLEQQLLDDYIPALADCVSDRCPSLAGHEIQEGTDEFVADADDLMHHEWHEVSKLVEMLQDGLQSINPEIPVLLPWQ